MKRRQLEQELAAATGESVRTIRRQGFSLLQPQHHDFDPEPNDLPVRIVDWDELDSQTQFQAA